MKQAILGALVATVLLGGAYRLGQNDPILEAQGRGPVIPPKPRSDSPTTAPRPLVYESGGSNTASANGFVAW